MWQTSERNLKVKVDPDLGIYCVRFFLFFAAVCLQFSKQEAFSKTEIIEGMTRFVTLYNFVGDLLLLERL